MSMTATRPMDIWSPSTNYAMMQQCHFAERLGAATGALSNVSHACPVTSAAAQYQSSMLFAAGAAGLRPSAVMTPEGSASIHSSPSRSPAETPVYCEGDIPQIGGGALHAVKLPKVLDDGQAKTYRRRQATKREARRAVSIRKAFTSLEDCLPGHEERSFTRLEILELAGMYIQELTCALKKQESGPSALHHANAKLINKQRQQLQQQQAPLSCQPMMTSCVSGLAPTQTFSAMSVRVDTPPAESAAAAAAAAAAASAAAAAASGLPLCHGPSGAQAIARSWQRAPPLSQRSSSHQGFQAAQLVRTLPRQASQPAFHSPSPTTLSLAPDLNVLDIGDLFHSPDGETSDRSSNWSDLVDEALST